MTTQDNPAVAPSATPATNAPVSASAPAAAPSAAPELKTLADFDRMAAEALRANVTPPQPAAPQAAPAEEGSPQASAATPEAAASDEDAPESAEELASLGDAGLRALENERARRKTARAELKAAQEKIAELESRLATPTPAESPVAATATETQTAPAVAPQTQAVPQNLAECRTFDQVDAVTMQAIQTKAVAQEMIMAMVAGDRDTVLAKLREQRVEKIGTTPIDEASDTQLRQLIVNAQTGCEMTLNQAPLRKELLRKESVSFSEARNLLPGLANPTSAEAKAFVAVVNANPAVRNLGPDWPLLVAQNVAFNLGKSKPVTPAAVQTPVAKPPTPKAAPGAPRTASAALPKRSELDEVVARLNSGKGTTKDMERYAVLSMQPQNG